MVKLDPGDARTPVLQWYEIKRSGKHGGELLAAFELFQVRRVINQSPLSLSFSLSLCKILNTFRFFLFFS